MIRIYDNPPRTEWPDLQRRNCGGDDRIAAAVDRIVERVRRDGDRALTELTEEIDGVKLAQLKVSADEMAAAAAAVPEDLKRALAEAAANIRRFHEAQRPAEVDVETAAGVRCRQRAVPIERIGLYVPGGRAPLFSTVLMLGIPASVAGCRDVAMCTPADSAGRVADAVLYAASLCGIRDIYKVGGAQAIAAMAYGTESIARRDKIFGPGNRYVTRAKQTVGGRVCAIDMPAGPSEVMVLADDRSDGRFIAADLLSQAEHGDDSQSILLCTSRAKAEEVAAEVARQAERLSRRETVARSLAGSRIIVLPQLQDMIDFADGYAPEHLIVQIADPWRVAGRIAAGSVFVGDWSPESAGDYASGTNHTLPTSGWARSMSGVNLDSFIRKITYQELTREGLAALAPTIVAMAEAEGLDAHAEAVRVRLNMEKL